MLKIIKSTVTVSSLVAFLLLSAFWVRSLWHLDFLEADNPRYFYFEVVMERGIVSVRIDWEPGFGPNNVKWTLEDYLPDYHEPIPGRFGFFYEQLPYGYTIQLPFWFLVVLTGLLAALVGIRRPFRFRLRTLVVTITIAAVWLGLVVNIV